MKTLSAKKPTPAEFARLVAQTRKYIAAVRVVPALIASYLDLDDSQDGLHRRHHRLWRATGMSRELDDAYYLGRRLVREQEWCARRDARQAKLEAREAKARKKLNPTPT